VHLVFLLVRVYLLAVVDLHSQIEGLVLNLLPLHLSLGGRGALLLGLRLLLLALGLLRGHLLLGLALRGHIFLLIFLYLLFLRVVVAVEFQGLRVLSGESPFIIVALH
jgi:hypothetical protein